MPPKKGWLLAGFLAIVIASVSSVVVHSILLGLLPGLAFLCMSVPGSLAGADQTTGLPPRIASVLWWLPDDTETLIVARSGSVPSPIEAVDWRDYGAILAFQGLTLDRQKQFSEYDVRLIPAAKDVRDIPTGLKGLIIVATVDNVLHFRIFDREGKLVVETNEKSLPEQARQIDELRKQLEFWRHRPEAIDKGSVICAVTSIVDQAQLKPLRGRKVEYIVHGARNFEGVSSFGSLRSESCTIIVFESDLGEAATEWTEGLRRGAKSIRSMIGREVFVYPSPTLMEPWGHETRWQGAYFVVLKPNMLLGASSDRYLESVLRRVDEAPGDRALPDNLPEWRHVDFEAPVWMLRHVPKVGGRANIIGSTTAFTSESFRVVYIPKPGSDVNMKPLEREWLPQSLFNTPRLGDQLSMARRPDGTVVLSCGGKPGEDTLWFTVFQLYRLQAFELFLDDR